MPNLRRPDLVPEIATQMRNRIVTGAMAPGVRIMEARLARAFGTSRAPVREASRILEGEGLLVSSANRGFSVRDMTVGDFIELTDFRICVERYAVRRVAEDPDREQVVADLTAISARMSMLESLREGAARAISDIDFHLRIVRAAESRRLLAAYEQMINDLQVAMHLMSLATAGSVELSGDHDTIIAAIDSGDAAAAEAAIERHIRIAWQETIDYVSSNISVPLSVARKRR